MQAHELVSRASQDLDLATDAPAGMNEITDAVVAGLEERGWAIRTVEVAPRMSRPLATDTATDQSCELDILKEIFHKPPAQTESGPMLSRDDAVGLKVRALHDRGFPRDVIDVFSARELYTIAELERLGAQHDEEFDLEELHGRLEVVDFTSDREYAAYGIHPAGIAALRAWVHNWLDDLGLRLAEPYTEDEDGD
ncbi:nucleotidyl transferase AbiEii/AbiGii toxin family protein [Streptomyces sp. NPDC001351]|uniref:nucleotidyl transferase AbiEii/AbiGii toxin family protein n=1 Tax=Streptomyces sp. NPDC001351 TaxID=3364564 RepID=UPI0036B10155